MSGSLKRKSILAAALCILTLSSSAFAKSSLQSEDPNDSRTVAGMKFKNAMKTESCPFAHKGGRTDVAFAAKPVNGSHSSSKTIVR